MEIMKAVYKQNYLYLIFYINTIIKLTTLKN